MLGDYRVKCIETNLNSIWVFLLLGSEAIKTYKSHPNFRYDYGFPITVSFLTSLSLGPYKIPTWTSPMLACVVVSILISNVSFLGHMCAILVGYLREFSSFLPHNSH
jgi:glycosylphosphatidylinositol transamidase